MLSVLPVSALLLLVSLVLLFATATAHGYRVPPPKRSLGKKTAKALGLCNNPITPPVDSKSGRGGNQFVFDVCNYTLPEGFHFVCTAFSFDEAWQVCAQAGWRLAVVEDATSFAAFDMTDACMLPGSVGAWIASYSGMGALPCMYIQPDGTIVQSNGANCNAEMPVICQDIPPLTVTVPSIFSTDTLFVTATETVQVCALSPCSCVRNCRQRQCAPCDGGAPYTDAVGNVGRWPRCCDPQSCNPLCPTALNDLYVISSGGAALPYSLAERECRKYGLYLADLTSALLPSFASLSTSCGAEHVWIRSFNGIGGHEQCVWAMRNANGTLPIGYGVIEGACFGLTVRDVLCQDRPPAQLGHGPFVGTVGGTEVTVTSGVEYIFTVTVATDTTTVTFFP